MPKKAVQSGSALMASNLGASDEGGSSIHAGRWSPEPTTLHARILSNWGDYSSSDEGGSSSSKLKAGRWTTDQQTMHARRIVLPQRKKRVVDGVRGGGQKGSSSASSVGSANTVAETLGNVDSLKRRLLKAIHEHGVFTGASVDALVQQVGVLVFTILLSWCYTLLKALWRVEDQESFQVSTASGRKARSSNQAVIGRYLGGQAWKAVKTGGLTGSEAYGRIVILLMGAMHGRLAFARKMCSRPTEWITDPVVSGWIQQFGAEHEDGVFPSAEVFFGKTSEDMTIQMTAETVATRVETAIDLAMHECNEFFDDSRGRKPPVYVVAKKLVECLRGTLLEEMCGEGDAAVNDIVASMNTEEGRMATGQMLGTEVVVGMQAALEENAGLGEVAVRALAGAAVNAFLTGQMDIFGQFLADSLNSADHRVQALFGQEPKEKEDTVVPRIEYVSG